MVVDIKVNTNNLAEATMISEILQTIADNLDIKDFEFFKKNKINWKKLSQKAQKNPMLLNFI